MSRLISQRELRNQSGEIMRALDRGEVFLITRNGIPVGELRPLRRRFIGKAELLGLMTGAPRVDAKAFRADVDGILDQDIEPRS